MAVIHQRRGSPVSPLAIENALNFQVIAVISKKDAVVLSAQPDQLRSNAPKLLRRAFTGGDVSAQSFGNLDSDRLLNTAHVRFGLIGPDDPFGHLS